MCKTDEFRWLSGEEGIRKYEDTPGYRVQFCGRCGSPVPSHLEQYDAVFLHVGGLNEDPRRRISHHIFVDSKAPWYEIDDDHPQFEEHRPMKP